MPFDYFNICNHMGQGLDMKDGVAFAQLTIAIEKLAKCMTDNLPSFEASCTCQAEGQYWTWWIMGLMEHGRSYVSIKIDWQRALFQTPIWD